MTARYARAVPGRNARRPCGAICVIHVSSQSATVGGRPRAGRRPASTSRSSTRSFAWTSATVRPSRWRRSSRPLALRPTLTVACQRPSAAGVIGTPRELGTVTPAGGPTAAGPSPAGPAAPPVDAATPAGGTAPVLAAAGPEAYARSRPGLDRTTAPARVPAPAGHAPPATGWPGPGPPAGRERRRTPPPAPAGAGGCR